jgi:hypothetical protein
LEYLLAFPQLLFFITIMEMVKQLAGHLPQVTKSMHSKLSYIFNRNVFFSGVFAAAALHLAVLIHKKTIQSWYSVLHLRSIQVAYWL